jgi:hypothetical protein
VWAVLGAPSSVGIQRHIPRTTYLIITRVIVSYELREGRGAYVGSGRTHGLVSFNVSCHKRHAAHPLQPWGNYLSDASGEAEGGLGVRRRGLGPLLGVLSDHHVLEVMGALGAEDLSRCALCRLG